MFQVIKPILKFFFIAAILSIVMYIIGMIFLLIWELFAPVTKPVQIITQALGLLIGYIIAFVIVYKNWKKKRVVSKHIKDLNKKTTFKESTYTINFNTNKGKLKLNNPFRGIFVVGGAGSGKSESIAIPLIKNFVEQDYSGLIYDFKFPSLANEVESFLKLKGSDLKHFYLDFNNPYQSYRVNPLAPEYILNTSYAREYAQSIISNLMKETIKKPDYWSRSATDLLTACIWYLKSERPRICDLPHVLAMITSPSRPLLECLQRNVQTAQMTISLFDAMERGSENQLSGVLGTLQSAISQINTPEICYIFGSNDFSLDLNNPKNPSVLTVGNYPTLSSTFAPLCSLVITVTSKLMNQQGKHHSFLMLDEAPTIYIPNFEMIPNTARSNKVATVYMCQDLSQMVDMYGQEKADNITASLNTHFYGRVAYSKTAETLSKQFGKSDRYYVSRSKSAKPLTISTSGKSQSVQERERIKPNEFLNFDIGRFAGIAVESNMKEFDLNFKQEQRPETTLLSEFKQTDMFEYYNQVREEVDLLLGR